MIESIIANVVGGLLLILSVWILTQIHSRIRNYFKRTTKRNDESIGLNGE